MINEVDEILGDFDWEEYEKTQAKETPIGSDIQRVLRDECLKVSPYVKIESGTSTRFDLAMYLPQSMPFIADKPINYHCWWKYRRLYCQRIWREVESKYAIPKKERDARYEKSKKECEDREETNYFHADRIPLFRYKGIEYMYSEDFWKSNAKKELAVCNQPDCKWWKEEQKEKKKEQKKYGFMSGLHLFEIKSDKDSHDLLIHQIPNMVAIADYVWLVLGEKQPKPEWLPPYISVLRYKKGKFKIEYKHSDSIKQPPMYQHVLGIYNKRIENSELYALAGLIRKWRINSMFHFTFEGQMVIDMTKDIEKLLTFLRRADKHKSKEDFERFQKSLIDFEAPSDSVQVDERK